MNSRLVSLVFAIAALGCTTEDGGPMRSQPLPQANGGSAGAGGDSQPIAQAGASGMPPARVPVAPVPAGSSAPAPTAGSSGAVSTGGTGGTSDAGADTAVAQPSSGCGTVWMPSDAQLEPGRRGVPMQVARREVTINGVQRRYLLAVPPDYDSSTPYPLVFGFHGLGGNREQLRGYMNVETPAAGRAIFIYPEGLLVERSGDTGWNTSADSDDLAFVDALLAQYVTELCIDEGRIFATGHSFGGCMSNTVGCHRGDIFRAIAPVAGCGPFSRRGTACVGQVAALLVHSPMDAVTDYRSGISGCTHWLRANGCGEMPACGCHFVESLASPEDACMQEAQETYDPGVPIEVTAEDDAPPVFRRYLDCDPGHPVVFVDHYNRENRTNQEERWHNPPPWAPSVIWQFFSALEPMETQ